MLLVQVTILDYLVVNRDTISHLLTYIDDLTTQQWSTIDKLSSTLRPLITLSHLLSTTTYPVLSTVIPVVTELRRQLSVSTGGHEAVRQVLVQVLDETLSSVYEDNELCAATVVGLWTSHQLLQCHISRTSVLARRAFTVLRSTCS